MASLLYNNNARECNDDTHARVRVAIEHCGWLLLGWNEQRTRRRRVEEVGEEREGEGGWEAGGQ